MAIHSIDCLLSLTIVWLFSRDSLARFISIAPIAAGRLINTAGCERRAEPVCMQMNGRIEFERAETRTRECES